MAAKNAWFGSGVLGMWDMMNPSGHRLFAVIFFWIILLSTTRRIGSLV